MQLDFFHGALVLVKRAVHLEKRDVSRDSFNFFSSCRVSFFFEQESATNPWPRGGGKFLKN